MKQGHSTIADSSLQKKIKRDKKCNKKEISFDTFFTAKILSRHEKFLKSINLQRKEKI